MNNAILCFGKQTTNKLQPITLYSKCNTMAMSKKVLQNEAENGKMHAQVNISANWPNKNEIKTLKDFHKQRLLW